MNWTTALVIGLNLFCFPAAVLAETGAHYFRSDSMKAMNRPFSDAVQVGSILYLSGQIGSTPDGKGLVPGGMEAETKQVMENIGAVLKANGRSYSDVFKCTVMLADMRQWGDFNKIYVTYFKPNRLPARSALGANGLALGAAVEVECWAVAN
jgi:reactive intermediate/imine deaminase